MLLWVAFSVVLVGRGQADTSSTVSTTASKSTALSTTSPVHATGETNVFAIILKAPESENATTDAWGQLFSILATSSISVFRGTVNQTNGTESVQVTAPLPPGLISLNITNVTSDFQGPLEKINNVTKGTPTEIFKANDTKSNFLFLDVCDEILKTKNATMTNVTLIALFDAIMNSSSFHGLFINLTNEVDVPSNVTSFSRITRNHTDLGHSYFITLNENLTISTFMNGSTRLCRGFIDRQIIKPPPRTTVNPCTNTTANETGCQTNATTPGTAAKVTVISTTGSNATSPIPVPTTIQPVNGTQASVTEKYPIITGHPKASVALGVILTLIIVAVLCFVFRRRISTFVRAKMSRRRPVISTLGFAPYGTLRNENEYMDLEDFSARGQSGTR